MIDRILTALEATVLGLWAGAMAGFAFIFAPVAFRLVTPLDTFAALTATVIRGVGTFGSVCGALAILASLVRARKTQARPLALARMTLVVVALVAAAYENKTVIPAMESTAKAIPGPLDSVPKSDPRRVAYDRQHTASTRVYGTAFLCVLAAAACAAFGRSEQA